MMANLAVAMGRRLLLSRALMATGAQRVLAAYSRPFLFVANYHRLYASAKRSPSRFDDGVFGPDVGTFRRQVEWLRTNTQILDEAGLSRVLAADDLPRAARFSVITFDDGYVDCYSLARPVLDDLGVPGLFFVPVEMLETRRLGWWDIAAYLLKSSKHGSISLNGEELDLRNNLQDSLRRILAQFKLEKAEHTGGLLEELSRKCDVSLPGTDLQSAELMSWQQVREMKEAGHGIGSHSLSHRVLATLDRPSQEREIRQSKRELEGIVGASVISFAYPVGGPAHYNADSVKLARLAGYELAFTFNTGVARLPVRDRFQIPRESANSLDELQAKASLPRVMGLKIDQVAI